MHGGRGPFSPKSILNSHLFLPSNFIIKMYEKIRDVHQNLCYINIYKIGASGQDGGVGGHIVPPLTTKRTTTI